MNILLKIIALVAFFIAGIALGESVGYAIIGELHSALFMLGCAACVLLTAVCSYKLEF